MKHLELHIIQSVPVACLNRDDLNSPKTAVFGGVQRARVSSQSWKRSIRELAKETDETLFKGNRSRRMVFELVTKLEGKGVTQDLAVIIAEHVADTVETLDTKKKDTAGFNRIKTLMFFSDAEYNAIVDAVTEEVKMAAENLLRTSGLVTSFKEKMATIDDKEEKEKAKKGLKKIEQQVKKEKTSLAAAFKKIAMRKAIQSAQLMDAADIALFGRMVAKDHTLTVEASSMFSHALSTHKVDNEIDFFSAVDDLQTKEESGAGMTGTLEFNSATYYRFAALNLDMLADSEHLSSMNEEERKNVVRTFIEATIKAIPGARKNTMNGNTVPVYVLGIVREKGHPVQLINAFETPVRPSMKGFTVKSVNQMNEEYSDLKNTWNIDSVFAKATVKGNLKESIQDSLHSIETCSLNELISGMVEHVI